MRITDFVLTNIGTEEEARIEYKKRINDFSERRKKAVFKIFIIDVLVVCIMTLFLDLIITVIGYRSKPLALTVYILLSCASILISILMIDSVMPDDDVPMSYKYFNAIENKRVLRTELVPVDAGFCLKLTLANNDGIVCTRSIEGFNKLYKVDINTTIVDIRNRCVYIPYEELN